MPPQQLTWTYVSDAGSRYVVGLFHSLREGHLMVYCNQKVVLVDFKVFETRSYPLFLDDELFQIKVERKGNRFAYGFEIDKKADTPRNQWRRSTERKHWRHTMLFVLVLALFVGSFTYLFLRQDGPTPGEKVARAELIKYHGEETEGVVETISLMDGHTNVRFSFRAAGQQQRGRLQLPDSQGILKTGWPLQIGDRFTVRYVSDNPKLSTLQFKRPTPDQLEYYREQAMDRHLELHPELTARRASCLLDVALEQKGLQGWADFFHQETPPNQNPRANALTYRRLVRSLLFKDAAERNCWQ